MRQEFAAYGLSPTVPCTWSARRRSRWPCCLLVGEYFPALVRPAAVGMAVLMAGAIGMHVKIGDPPRKGVPAVVMLLLSCFVAAAPD